MEDQSSKKSFFSTYKTVLIIFVIVIAFLAYLGLQKYGTDFSKSKIFTQYPTHSKTDKPSKGDSLAFLEKIAEDTTEVVIDTLKVIDSIEIMDVEPVPKKEVELEKPVDTVQVVEQIYPSKNANSLEEDLFNQLIQVNQSKYSAFYKKDILTYKTLFKLAAITGKTTLLEGRMQTIELFEALVEEKEIAEILVCNRQGKIIYTSNSKFKQRIIQSVLPGIRMEQDFLEHFEVGDKWLTTIPIYHTYGRIGTVVVSMLK